MVSEADCKSKETRSCDECLKIGRFVAGFALSERKPDLSQAEVRSLVETSMLKARIEGSGSEVLALRCFARQDRAERIGHDIGETLGRERRSE